MSTAERLEELRDLPRVTTADRKRYRAIAHRARKELSLVEPADADLERQKALVARKYKRATVDAYACRDVTIEQWRARWRSLPDYDGPPMRAPSGTDYHRVFRADGSSRVAIPLRVEGSSLGNAQLAALFGEIEQRVPSGREKREISVYENATNVYARPSEGGRGWCPKLAGVQS